MLLYTRQSGEQGAEKQTCRNEDDGSQAHHNLTFGDPNSSCRMHPISSLQNGGTFFIGSSR